MTSDKQRIYASSSPSPPPRFSEALYKSGIVSRTKPNDSRLIDHRHATEILLIINGQRIGRVSPAISPDISLAYRSTYQLTYRSICRVTYRPMLNRHPSTDMSTDISTNISVEPQPVCRPIICRDVDRYIGQGVRKLHMIQLFF